MGLMLDAEIAATCQQYVVDLALFKKELGDDEDQTEAGEEEKEEEGDAATMHGGDVPSEVTVNSDGQPTKGNVNGGGPRPKEEAKPTSDNTAVEVANVTETNNNAAPETPEIDGAKANGVATAPPASDDGEGDLNEYSGNIYCNSCLKTIAGWRNGGVYLCVCCTEMDLCDDCHGSKGRARAGQTAGAVEARLRRGPQVRPRASRGLERIARRRSSPLATTTTSSTSGWIIGEEKVARGLEEVLEGGTVCHLNWGRGLKNEVWGMWNIYSAMFEVGDMQAGGLKDESDSAELLRTPLEI